MIKKDTKEKSPAAYNKLVDTFKTAVASPNTLKLSEKQGMAPFIDYWSPRECRDYVQQFQTVWEKYKHLMD